MFQVFMIKNILSRKKSLKIERRFVLLFLDIELFEREAFEK